MKVLPDQSIQSILISDVFIFSLCKIMSNASLHSGSKIHGLTVSGKVQARRAAGILIETVKRENLQNLVFLSSNFTRARETAEETLKVNRKITTDSGECS